MSPSTEPAAIRIALAGNPNSGKSTLFNRLTGSNAHVGNYPGVTVERKEGSYRHAGQEVQVLDLPGTYSLTAYTLEEVVARRALVAEGLDLVVHVADASNLERNLYLAVQILELNLPVVIALNKRDQADQKGLKIDHQALGDLLGAVVVPTVGTEGEGLEELKEAIRRTAAGERPEFRRFHYGKELEEHGAEIEALLGELPEPLGRFPRRWVALKLLEGDREVLRALAETHPEQEEILARVERVVGHLRRVAGDDPEILLADRRYGVIGGAYREAVIATVERRYSMSERIDGVLTHRLWGLPIFLAAMYGTFWLTFTLGEPPMDWIEAGFGWISGLLQTHWPWGADHILLSLLVDGVIGGVGGVVIFLPNILLLFLAIAFLEDSGYMARAAFLTDRFMHRVGLHGKSFVPMVIGFGCTVPAILATRTLASRRDRLATMMVLPLFSCGARLPIYGLLIPAFFPAHLRAPILYGIYMLGVVMALGLVRLLTRTILAGDSTPFVMELPPYRMPPMKGLLQHAWDRGWLYLRKAGTVILGISAVMWVLSSYPRPPAEAMSELRAGMTTSSPAEIRGAERSLELRSSLAGRIGQGMAVVLEPAMGFDWRISTAFLGAFAAKEIFVAQMGIVLALGETEGGSSSLRAMLQANYTPLVGLCIMLFALIATPCMATVAATRQESGSWGWALLQLGGLTALALVVTTLVYQIGSLLGLGV